MNKLGGALLGIIVGLAGSVAAAPAVAGAVGKTERASVPAFPVHTQGDSTEPVVSADGRFVAFSSVAKNLVADDTTIQDVFVRDRETGETTRVSVAADGSSGDGSSFDPAISADGLIVAFTSDATNLVVGDRNDKKDVFVHNRQTGETTRVSISSSRDAGNDNSRAASLSGDGRYVAFSSEASNLVGDDANVRIEDVFVHDRKEGTTERVSLSADAGAAAASQAPDITDDGRFVTFESQAADLVEGDTNDSFDVFVHDRGLGTTERVSVGSAGTQANGAGSYYSSISSTGRYVAFHSFASNLIDSDTNGVGDVFVRDRQLGTTQRVSVTTGDVDQATGESLNPAISGNGKYVAFHSAAPDLVRGDTNNMRDIFGHSLVTGATERLSVSTDGSQATGASDDPAVSGDGRYVVFHSSAANLVAEDRNGKKDVFVRDRLADTTPPRTRITTGPAQGGFLLGTATRIRFASSEQGSTFKCRLDGRRQICAGAAVRLTRLAQRTHEFRVRATDSAGNADRSAAVRTWTVPRNNTGLRNGRGWTKRRGRGYYLGTFSQSRHRGSVLSTRVSGARALSLVATKAPRQGTVKVYLGRKLLRRVSLTAPKTHRKRLIPLAAFRRGRNGTVKIVVVSQSRTVRIEGLGVVTR